MPFSPDTTIYLFKDTGVTPENQPYFTKEVYKMSWYWLHENLKFEAQSYQRELKQYTRLNVSVATIRGYDMMCYRNAEDERWIICRITGTEFVNPNTTDVFFEVDPMQTWCDTIEWKDCWVEREMADDDWIDDQPSWNNTIVEGINPGTPYGEQLYETKDEINSQGWVCHVLSAYDAEGMPNYSITAVGNYYSGINDIMVNPDNGELALLLQQYANKGKLDGIVGIWAYPKKFSNYSPTATFFSIFMPKEIAGYTPKNSKCFSSEFCRIELVNRMGDSVEYGPEYFHPDAGGAIQFIIEGCFAYGSGGIRCAPVRYMGFYYFDDGKAPLDYGVVLPANIQCAYVGDAFANWLSQNRVGVAAQLIGAGAAVAGGVVAAATGAGAAAGALSVAQGISSAAATIGSITSKISTPAGVYGQSSGMALFPATDTFSFRVNFKSPGYEVIKSIDDFFSVYGYKTCRMKKPNINTRPYWNYVKCAPANIGGPMNSKDRQLIEQSLNNGVTFWHCQKGATIGDYSKDNRRG